MARDISDIKKYLKDEEDVELLQKIISVSNISKFQTLPNFRFNDSLEPPCGYISLVDAKKPMYSDLFMTNWYEGVSIKSLENVNFGYLNKQKVKDLILLIEDELK